MATAAAKGPFPRPDDQSFPFAQGETLVQILNWMSRYLPPAEQAAFLKGVAHILLRYVNEATAKASTGAPAAQPAGRARKKGRK